jgi:peptidoglycan/LPS O-acetylase OafA/YrhL
MHHQALNPLSTVYMVACNLFIFGQDGLHFLMLNHADGLLKFTKNFRETSPQIWMFLFVPQAWSVSLELYFYLIAPFLMRRKFITLLTLVLAGIFLKFLAIKMGFGNDPWTYRFFPFELPYFLMGALGYMLYRRLKLSERKKSDRKLFLCQIGYFLLIALTIVFVFPIYDIYSSKGFLIANFYFIIFSILLPLAFAHTKNNLWDRQIGEISYPLYLSHILIIHLFSFHYLNITFCVLISIGLSVILLKYVTTPFEKYRLQP